MNEQNSKWNTSLIGKIMDKVSVDEYKDDTPTTIVKVVVGNVMDYVFAVGVVTVGLAIWNGTKDKKGD